MNSLYAEADKAVEERQSYSLYAHANGAHLARQKTLPDHICIYIRFLPGITSRIPPNKFIEFGSKFVVHGNTSELRLHKNTRKFVPGTRNPMRNTTKDLQKENHMPHILLPEMNRNRIGCHIHPIFEHHKHILVTIFEQNQTALFEIAVTVSSGISMSFM